MNKIKEISKKIKLLWHDSEEENFNVINGKYGKFNLFLGKTLVGTLLYENGLWIFTYSEDFKNQKDSVSLVNFPNKEKIYRSNQLWPFFVSRLPGSSNLDNESKEMDMVDLLKKYGKRVITNPYILV